MTTDENFTEAVKVIIRDWSKNEGFKERKLTDTPTDDLQVVNKKYVDDNVSKGYKFVSYNTVTANTITVTGLDLATDKQYQVVIACRNITNAGIIYWQNNADSGANKHHWISTGYHATLGIQNANSEGATKWELSESGGTESQLINLTLAYNNSYVLSNWNMGGNGYSGDAGLRMATATGAGYWASSDNITSFVLTHNSGDNCDWAVWVFKSSQS